MHLEEVAAVEVEHVVVEAVEVVVTARTLLLHHQLEDCDGCGDVFV